MPSEKRDRRPKIYTHKVHGLRVSQQAHCTLPHANASFLHKQKYRTRRKSKVWAVEALKNLADWTVSDRKWTSFIRTFFLAHLSGLCSHGEKPPPTGVPPASHCNGNERDGEEMKNHFSLLPQKTFATIRRRGGGLSLSSHLEHFIYERSDAGNKCEKDLLERRFTIQKSNPCFQCSNFHWNWRIPDPPRFVWGEKGKEI